MTRESAQFLRDLLGTVSLKIDAPDFAETAAAAQRAKAELDAILAD